MGTAVSSAELCWIFCAIRADVIYNVLTAGTLSRDWFHIVLDALLRQLTTIRDCGSQAYRHLHVTEGLHFQTILRIRCYYRDHRERAAAESAVGFGETPIVVSTVSAVNTFQRVNLRHSRVHSTTIH